MLFPSYNDQHQINSPIVLSYFDTYALVTSQTDNTITISYFDSVTHEENGFQTYSILAHHSIQIPLDTNRMRIRSQLDLDTSAYRCCHLVAKAPVNVEYYSTGANSGGSYLALPVQCWGKNYVVESYKDNASGAGGYLSSEDASGCFTVIAAYDSTTIEIALNSTSFRHTHTGVNCGAGANGSPQPYTITLQRGQRYQVKSTGNDSYCDISGSTVISNKPVAVIAGHENAFTDGSDVGTILVEQRDFMIEQMIPVEYWDSTGYVTIPFVHAANGSGGEGDNIAMFYGKPIDALSGYPKGQTITIMPQSTTYSIGPYPSSVSIKSGVVVPTTESGSNGAKFHIVQYEQRMQGTMKYNIPAPSQLSIIPMSGWKNEYQWCVTPNNKELWQFSFCNIICHKDDYYNDLIQLSVNGNSKSLRLSDSLMFGIKPIPGYPQLIGLTLKLKPGSYHIKDIAKGSDTIGYAPLVVYNAGSRVIDPTGLPLKFNSGTHFFSYANPTGMLCRQQDIPRPKMSAIITESCGKWSVCVTDSGSSQNGIKFIELLNYPSSNTSATIPTVHNVSLSRNTDSLGKNEIILSGNDKSYCFDAFVKNLQDSAMLSFATYDNSGERLTSFTSWVPSLAKVTSSGSISAKPSGEFAFTPTAIDTTLCGRIVISRPPSIYTTDLTIDSIFLLHGKLGLSFASALPKFPVTLHPGDSIVLDVCYKTQGKYLSIDSIAIRTAACGSEYYLSLQGQVISGQLTAPDVEFGSIFRSDSLCKTIRLKNTGSASFLLKGFTLSDSVTFSVSSPLFKFLPFTLDTGESVDVTVCFYPHDDSLYTAQIVWETDISSNFIAGSKLKTTLNGRGTAFDIAWVPEKSAILADSTKKPVLVIKRQFLHNRTSEPATISDVHLSGANKDEFTIAASQKNTITYFVIEPNDSLWFDVAFVPDISKPYPDRFADRKADLVAIFKSSPKDNVIDSVILKLAGTFNSHFVFGVRNNQKVQKQLSAYINNGLLIINFTDMGDKTECSLYDILGRKVYSWNKQDISTLASGISLPMPVLSSGVYIVRINDERSCTIVVQ